MRRVAVTMQKGGVGKTTIALALADALSRRHRRVLLVDLDPQGWATLGAGLPAAYEADTEAHLGTALVGRLRGSLSELLLESPHGFAVLPSHMDLVVQKRELTSLRGAEVRLRHLLDHFDSHFDWMVLDTPPNLGTLSDNAVVAAGQLLVPVLLDRHSLRALRQISLQLDELADAGFPAQIQGVVVNQVTDTVLAREVRAALSATGLPVLAELRRRVTVSEAYATTRPLFDHDPSGQPALAIEALAADLERLALVA